VDPIHVNTLSILGEGHAEPFRAGRVLFAARSLDLVGVVDLAAGQVVWSWGEDVLDWPHEPTLLDSGNILVFDNGAHRGHSRILEVDPGDGAIVWQFEGDPPSSFFSRIMGGAQPLPNGNVLVTESV